VYSNRNYQSPRDKVTITTACNTHTQARSQGPGRGCTAGHGDPSHRRKQSKKTDIQQQQTSKYYVNVRPVNSVHQQTVYGNMY